MFIKEAFVKTRTVPLPVFPVKLEHFFNQENRTYTSSYQEDIHMNKTMLSSTYRYIFIIEYNVLNFLGNLL